MNFYLLIITILHLKPTQVVFQVKSRLIKEKYVLEQAPSHIMPVLVAEPVPRYKSLMGDSFTFLNLSHTFTDWNFVGNGTLFTYNQNYFDFINADGISKEEACKWIDQFILDEPIITWGLDSYPIALRGINWIKFFCKYPDCATKEREDSLWSQYKLLEKKLEFHLLGNHLLEDAFSLYIGACYFQDSKMKAKAYRLLLEQLHEQTLEDGAHYEQSPMYHCILLDRLLDCINFGSTPELREIAIKQLGWLKSICYSDGSWPFFNDAALGIAPTPKEIFDYAARLGIEFRPNALGASGYRKMQNNSMEVMADIGGITSTYQPGHTHADSLNYELRIDGKPFVVDTGISTYNKTPRRQYERSTIAHNCVVPANNYGTDSSQSSSQVWGGFRVGKRCKVSLINDAANEVSACHNGFSKPCSRLFRMEENAFVVEDQYDGEGISLIHLAQDADLKRIYVEGASKIEIDEDKYSVEYNRFLPCKVMKIYFTDKLRYTIR